MPPTPQLVIPVGDGLAAALASACQRFPNAATVMLDEGSRDGSGCDDLLPGCLEALPNGCLPSVELFGKRGPCGEHYLQPQVAVHVVRICPRLRKARVCCHEDGGGVFAAALKVLAATAESLDALHLWLRIEPRAAPRAGAALAHLRGLRRLGIRWDFQEGPSAEPLLAAALPSLAALSSLGVECGHVARPASPRLTIPPKALRELVLTTTGRGAWPLEALGAAPQLAAVTKLKISG